MREAIFVYLPDVYGVEPPRFATVDNGKLKIQAAVELRELSGLYVTIDAGALADEFRRHAILPSFDVVDLGEAIRMLTAISRADGGEREWDVWRHLRPHFPDNGTWRRVRDNFRGQRIVAAGDLGETFEILATAIRELWISVLKKLQAASELDRFLTIEQPVANVFFRRQVAGIAVNLEKTDQALKLAEKRKYGAYQAVAASVGTSPTGLNYWNVGHLLPKTDFVASSPLLDGYALRDQMKLARESSTFAHSFTELMDATRDVDILSRLGDSGGRVYPTFHPMGTISARTLVSDPYLQELRRDFRYVVSADRDNVLLYADYAQFEPGVMAFLSEDDALIEMYNTGDVYRALSVAIYGSSENRTLSKRVFLAFSYGMSVEAISELVTSNPEEQKRIGASVTAFFQKFPKLVEFRVASQELLQRNGHVVTLNGNRRKRTKTGGPLSPKEQRWAVSHRIQGTASLIFKSAVAEIAQCYGENSILLPMHDAVLLQCNQASRADMTTRTTEIMENAFSRWCPTIKAQVKFEEYHS